MLRWVDFSANELANPIGQYGEPEPPQQPELRELLLQQAGTPRGDIINTKIIGNWLTSVCVRIHNGMRIELVKGSRAHGNKYTLITVADPQKG